MGNRALVVFVERNGKQIERCSPVVYLHDDGYRVRSLLELAAPYMDGSASYSAARFIGVCHAEIPPPLSLGVFNCDKRDLSTPKRIGELSHGDCGVFIVVCGGPYEDHAGEVTQWVRPRGSDTHGPCKPFKIVFGGDRGVQPNQPG